MSLIRLNEASLCLSNITLLDNADLVIHKGERLALLGRNGSGKSTLLKVIMGEIMLDGGSFDIKSQLKIAILDQALPPDCNDSVYNIVATGFGDIAQLIHNYNMALENNTTSSDELLTLQHKLDQNNGWAILPKIDTILSKLNLDGARCFNDLSGGMQRQVLLAKALVNDPDLLLLDEPTNHLDVIALNTLWRCLQTLTTTSVLLISHDRYFIRKFAERIIELDRGKLSNWPGNYDNYLRRKAEALHAEELANKRFDKKLSEEEIWIRKGIQARRTRNEGRVRALKTMRTARALRQKQQGRVQLTATNAEQSGKRVIDVENIWYSYDTTPIINDFSTTIFRGDKIGLVGKNGVGKTTLLKLLLGKLQPEQGVVKHGTKLQIVYFDQLQDQLDQDKSVRDNMANEGEYISVNGKQQHVVSYLKSFLFEPERTHTLVRSLSGGEKNRLLLARLFSKPSNLMVLDEPTNDLDIDTLELLEELIATYQGSVLLVSHDCEFLNNVVTSTIVFKGDGELSEIIGFDNSMLLQQPLKSKKTINNNNLNTTTKNGQKLSYNEMRELKKLPEQIDNLENKKSELQQQIAEPNFYKQEENEITIKLSHLQNIEDNLKAAYSRWELLDSIQE